MEGIFQRSELLLGKPFMDYVAKLKVIIFGVGGVGSWCAEGLIRSGITHLTIVDSDCVAVSNVNRQLMATCKTVGEVKVDALKTRLLEINPSAEINALQMVYNAETAESFHLEQYDYIVDAIDSLDNKSKLILHATRVSKECGSTFFSSMGAALRMDPLAVRSTEFWNIKGDALARALRNKFKKNQEFPAKKFKCVYSEEPVMENKGVDLSETREWNKAQTNGSLVQVTATFGFALVGLVMQDIKAKSIIK